MFDKIKALFSGKQPASADLNKHKPSADDKMIILDRSETQKVKKEFAGDKRPAQAPSAEQGSANNQSAGQGPANDRSGEKKLKKDHIPDPKPEAAAKITEESGEGKKAEPAGSRRNSTPGRELYRFMNQAMKTMHIRYSEGRFDELTHLGKISQNALDEYENILKKLPDDLEGWLSALRSMIVLRKEDGAVYTDIADREGIKKEFLNAMLPFYATYARQLGEGKVRFSSLIGPDMLRLFHELTGKKYTVGFHRRYESGINAFEWENDRYQVYDSKGTLLCDAVFKNGTVDHGYARIPEQDPAYEDWDIVKAGEWKEGSFLRGAVEYVYKIAVK